MEVAHFDPTVLIAAGVEDGWFHSTINAMLRVGRTVARPTVAISSPNLNRVVEGASKAYLLLD